MEIGDEFLNPDKEMEASVAKIQKFYRLRRKTTGLENEPKKPKRKKKPKKVKQK